MGRADFLEILRALVRHEVEFVVVGGLAAVFNGAPIVTLDVDLATWSSETNFRSTWSSGATSHT